MLVAVVLSVLPEAAAGAARDYYSVLGVPRGADEKQIKKAYKKQAMKWHPDKHQDSKSKEKATTKFQEIATAYETLNDPEKRRMYDLGGEEPAKGQPRSSPRQEGPGHRTSHGGWQQQTQRQGAETDPAMFETFRKAFTSRGSGAHGGPAGAGTNSFEFVFSDVPGQQGFPGPTASMNGQARRGTKQGASLFPSGPVRELNFPNHASEIQKLRGHRGALVLFYASGGKSCPKACHNIRKAYTNLATSRGDQVPVVAVQCMRRRGKCAGYATQFPAVVLFGRGASSEHVLSKGRAVSTAELRSSLDQMLLSMRSGSGGSSTGEKREGVTELMPSSFAGGADPCKGKFCLLLVEHASTPEVRKARVALADASRKLRNEPVQVFYVKAERQRNFVDAFGALAEGRFLRRRPAAQAFLYRPRRGRYEVFDGDVSNGRAIADFVSLSINRGSPLPHSVLHQPKMSA